jgi:hypothetical protein
MAEHRPQRIESVGRQARAPSWGGRLGESSAFSRERRAGSKERWKGGGASEMRKRSPSPFAADAVVPPPPPSPPPLLAVFFLSRPVPHSLFLLTPPPLSS